MKPQLGSSQESKPQIEHLQRQTVACRPVVLPDVASVAQQCQQPVNRRRRKLERARQLRDTLPIWLGTQGLTHPESLFNRCGAWRLRRSLTRHNLLISLCGIDFHHHGKNTPLSLKRARNRGLGTTTGPAAVSTANIRGSGNG